MQPSMKDHRDTRVVQHMQINVTLHIKRGRNNSNPIVTSIDAEKAFDQVQYPFMIKTLTKLGAEGLYLKLINSLFHNCFKKVK